MARRRKSGLGTVRERKGGRWEGRIVIGYDERGLPKTKNVRAETKTECLEKLEALKETIGATEITRCTPEMPFGEWIDFWYQNYCKTALPMSRESTIRSSRKSAMFLLIKSRQEHSKNSTCTLKATAGSSAEKYTEKDLPTR